MAFRTPLIRATKGAPLALSRFTSTPRTSIWQRGTLDQCRSFASVVPPVTQDATSSKGPTAIVFMNMGGPSTTGEVGDFLSNLFVRILFLEDFRMLTIIQGGWRLNSTGPVPKLLRTFDRETTHTQDN